MWLRLILLATLLCAACSRGGYKIPGPPTVEAAAPLQPASTPGIDSRARPRPVLVTRPQGALELRAVRAKVTGHAAASQPGLFELQLALDTGVAATVLYSPPGGLTLPVEPDQDVRLRVFPPDSEGIWQGPSLVIWDADDQVIAALAAGGGLPPGALGSLVDIQASSRIVYSDVRELPSLCTVVTLHYQLRVRIGEAFTWLAPGTVSELELGARNYQLVVLDVARASDNRCEAETSPNLSFALLRTDLGSPVVDRAAQP